MLITAALVDQPAPEVKRQSPAKVSAPSVDKMGGRTFGDLRPRSEWDKFYSLPSPKRNYTNVVKVV
jgi:hypothetical protein